MARRRGVEHLKAAAPITSIASATLFHAARSEHMSTKKQTRIIIAGGGFGGLYTALHLEKTLARDPDIEVTLINRENFFLFTPMLHEVAASDLDITHIVNPLPRLLRRVRFLDGVVGQIDLVNKRGAG